MVHGMLQRVFSEVGFSFCVSDHNVSVVSIWSTPFVHVYIFYLPPFSGRVTNFTCDYYLVTSVWLGFPRLTMVETIA